MSVTEAKRGWSAARHDRLATPITWIDIDQCLGHDPLVAKRVDEAGLPLSIGLIVGSVAGVRAVGAGNVEDADDVIDTNHHLIGCVRRVLLVPELTHNQLGTLTVEAQLNAMTRTDANMLDQPQHGDVPSDRLLHVGNGKHWDDPRPWG